MITFSGIRSLHPVGPVWRGGEQNEDQLLQDAYLNSLRLVAANSYTSVASKRIRHSSGINRNVIIPSGVPLALAALSAGRAAAHHHRYLFYLACGRSVVVLATKRRFNTMANGGRG